MFYEQMHQSWQKSMPNAKPLLDAIEARLAERQAVSGEDYLPDSSLVMRAFEQPIDGIRALIVGQDPYPTRGHAIGLSFAVDSEVRPLPRSLKNIMRELTDDLGRSVSANGDLHRWSENGVMLLNRHLTTEEAEPAAHESMGWAAFTDAAVSALNQHRGRKLVAILWGNHAQQLSSKLPDAQVIRSVHPSPLSARKGFFGSKPFSTSNRMLIEVGEPPIDWSC